MDSEIKIIDKLPAERWAEFKALRIEAITNEPIAFTFDLQKELSEPDIIWKALLKKNIMVFAECAGKLVGMGGVYLYKDKKFKHNANLESLYVSQEFRGNGIGGKLIEKRVEIISKMPGIKNILCEVFSSQIASVELHRKLRFEVVATIKDFVCINGEYFDSIHFEKQI